MRRLTSCSASKLTTAPRGGASRREDHHDYRVGSRYSRRTITAPAATVPWTFRLPPMPKPACRHLIEAVKRLVTADRRRVFEERGSEVRGSQGDELDRARLDASLRLGGQPDRQRRLTAELWDVIRNEDWSLVGGGDLDEHPGMGQRLRALFWNFDKPYRSVGWLGGGGLGNGPGSSVGAALANRKYGRFSVDMQNDGDFLYSPGFSGPRRTTAFRC